MIKSIHHTQIGIPQGAEPIAKAFYCDILGLKEIPKPESLSGRGGFWTQLGEIQIHFSIEEGVDRLATRAHIAYEVSSLEFWRTKLADQKIEAQNGIPIPGYVRFEFRDPFGNRVEFLQKTP